MPRFPSPHMASALARVVNGTLHGADRLLTGVATPEAASSDDLVFLEGKRASQPTRAGLILAEHPVPDRTTVVVPDPLMAMATLLRSYFPEPAPHREALHPSSRIHPTVTIHPGVVVGPGVEVGEDTVLFPNVVLYPGTRVGCRVRIHAGSVIGGDGFRYHPIEGGLLKIPHVGGVEIGDDVEIGNNVCIDRGMLGDTRIGRGAKIDNLVQVGHNCEIGPCAILVAQVGLSGSVKVGAGAILAGQVGVKDHVVIGAGARLGARSAVHRDVPPGETWLGAPARPATEAMKVYAALKYLPELVRKLGK